MKNDNYYLELIQQAKEFINEINESDLIFIANLAYEIWDKLEEEIGCVDNFRVSLLINNKVSAKYEEAESEGCCGFYDEDFTNKLTNNIFRIGFNYGH